MIWKFTWNNAQGQCPHLESAKRLISGQSDSPIQGGIISSWKSLRNTMHSEGTQWCEDHIQEKLENYSTNTFTLSKLSLCASTYVCMCARMCMHKVLVFACAFGGQRYSIFLDWSPPYFSKQVLSLNLEFRHSAWLAVQRYTHRHIRVWGYRCMPSSGFYVGIGI